MSQPELNKDIVLKALSTVIDPESKESLIQRGWVQDVVVCEDNVRLVLSIPPNSPQKNILRAMALSAVQKLDGAETVSVAFSEEEKPASAKPMASAAATGQKPSPAMSQPAGNESLPGIEHFIAVSSGKGGVGKSTVAVNLACQLAKEGKQVGLLDADIYGPNVHIMMGLEDVKLSASESGVIPPESHGVKVMSCHFFLAPEQKAAPMVLRGPMLDRWIREMLVKTDWGQLDYLIVDLPPGTGDAQMSITQAVPLDGAVIVTTPQEVALADSRKGLAMFSKVNVPILGLVENMSYYLLPDGERDYIFGEGGGEKASEELNVNFLGGIPLVTRLRREADAGRPIVIADPDGEQASVIAAMTRQVVDTIEAKAGSRTPITSAH